MPRILIYNNDTNKMETYTVDRFEEHTNTLSIPKTEDLPYLD